MLQGIFGSTGCRFLGLASSRQGGDACEGFGFELNYRWPDEGPLEFAFLKLGKTGVGIATTAPPPLPDWPKERATGSFQLCIYVDDTEAASERLVSQGAMQLTTPREMPWGEKLAYFEDPDGTLIHVTAVMG